MCTIVGHALSHFSLIEKIMKNHFLFDNLGIQTFIDPNNPKDKRLSFLVCLPDKSRNARL